jgi:hypothetical protein
VRKILLILVLLVLTTLGFTFTLTIPANLPESATVLLLGVGLIVVAALLRKRRSGNRASTNRQPSALE